MSWPSARQPQQRIETFMAYSFNFDPQPPVPFPLFESESGFVIGYLLDHLPSLRDELLHRLGDAVDAVPAVASGSLGRGSRQT